MDLEPVSQVPSQKKYGTCAAAPAVAKHKSVSAKRGKATREQRAQRPQQKIEACYEAGFIVAQKET